MLKLFITFILILNVPIVVFADETKGLRVVMLANTPNIKDHSFNEDIYNGLINAKSKYGERGLEVAYYSIKNDNEFVPMLEKLSDGSYDVVLIANSVYGDTVKNTALTHPNIKYISIDNNYKEDGNFPGNLAGVSFNETQSGYLAGIVAGGLTGVYNGVLPGLNPERKLGVIQAMDIPPIQRFTNGFKLGAKKLCRDCTIAIATVGSFNAPDKAKSIANSMYKDGIDIIFVVAAHSSSGAIEAAKQNKKYVFRGDSDQNYLAPDTIITSALKKTDVIVENIVASILDDKFKFGQNHVYGISEGGIGLAPFHGFDVKIPKELKNSVEQGKKDLLSGKVKPE